MDKFVFNEEKNITLKAERGVSFEMVINAIHNDKLLATLTHHNKDKYDNQKLFIVDINYYAYVVPFVHNEDEIFLKTIFPRIKMTKKYLGG